VAKRGADASGFLARKLRSEHIDAADLVLTATADQYEYVTALRPDAAGKTFVLGEFGRLLSQVDRAGLPDSDGGPHAVLARGEALVAAVDGVRDGASALPEDDLDDPWGRGEQTFTRIADEIDATVRPLAAVLLTKED
jgi:protein-tyrosine phosphatase